MEFIPAYANYGGDNYGEEVNPDFRERTFLMLAEHFGYDYEELEGRFRSYRDEYAMDHVLEADAFMDFLIEAIEGDLGIETRPVAD